MVSEAQLHVQFDLLTMGSENPGELFKFTVERADARRSGTAVVEKILRDSTKCYGEFPVVPPSEKGASCNVRTAIWWFTMFTLYEPSIAPEEWLT